MSPWRWTSLVPLLTLAVGCAGSNTIPTPRRDQGPVGDLPVFDTQSWRTDTNVAFNTCAATCAGCCKVDGRCELGEEDTLCGLAGGLCKDCTASGQYCVGKLCQACKPSCAGKFCQVDDGCGTLCQPGSGCCTPSCSGRLCGADDGCGALCQAGSGCCTPSCAGKLCGAADGCGGSCPAGSGCCTPNCNGKQCGDSDGCGKTCYGSCPWRYRCDTATNSCLCGPSPDFKSIAGVCLPSCGQLLGHLGVSVPPGSCCPSGCSGTNGGATWDCNYCCLTGCK